MLDNMLFLAVFCSLPLHVGLALIDFRAHENECQMVVLEWQEQHRNFM